MMGGQGEVAHPHVPTQSSGHPVVDSQPGPCGYVTATAGGSIVRVNQTLLRWLGRESGEVAGVVRFQELMTTGSRLLWLTRHLPRLQSAGEVRGVTLELLHRDGVRLPVVVAGVVAPTADGAPQLQLTIFDAAERRAYESELLASRAAAQEAERRARMLQQVTEACALASSVEDLLGPVTTAVVSAGETAGCAVWLRESASRRLDRMAVAELDDALAPAQLTVDDGAPFTDAWGTAEPVVLEASADVAERWPQVYTGMVAAGMRLMVAVPVEHDGERLGVLAVYLPYGRPCGDSDLDTLRTIGTLIGQALVRTRLHEQLRRLALHDALTGLPNRVLLMDRLEQAIAQATGAGGSFGVLLVDLDGFKQVNDTLGHLAGDRLLIAAGERLRASVREGDTVARLGGDEFALVCADVDETTGRLIAERIVTTLQRPFEIDGGPARVTGSVGVAISDATCRRAAEELLAEADQAMYDAKRRGKSRYVLRSEHSHSG